MTIYSRNYKHAIECSQLCWLLLLVAFLLGLELDGVPLTPLQFYNNFWIDHILFSFICFWLALILKQTNKQTKTEKQMNRNQYSYSTDILSQIWVPHWKRHHTNWSKNIVWFFMFTSKPFTNMAYVQNRLQASYATISAC